MVGNNFQFISTWSYAKNDNNAHFGSFEKKLDWFVHCNIELVQKESVQREDGCDSLSIHSIASFQSAERDNFMIRIPAFVVMYRSYFVDSKHQKKNIRCRFCIRSVWIAPLRFINWWETDYTSSKKQVVCYWIFYKPVLSHIVKEQKISLIVFFKSSIWDEMYCCKHIKLLQHWGILKTLMAHTHWTGRNQDQDRDRDRD